MAPYYYVQFLVIAEHYLRTYRIPLMRLLLIFGALLLLLDRCLSLFPETILTGKLCTSFPFHLHHSTNIFIYWWECGLVEGNKTELNQEKIESTIRMIDSNGEEHL